MLHFENYDTSHEIAPHEVLSKTWGDEIKTFYQSYCSYDCVGIASQSE